MHPFVTHTGQKSDLVDEGLHESCRAELLQIVMSLLDMVVEIVQEFEGICGRHFWIAVPHSIQKLHRFRVVWLNRRPLHGVFNVPHSDHQAQLAKICFGVEDVVLGAVAEGRNLDHVAPFRIDKPFVFREIVHCLEV